jgi:CRP-like cAMP-binding protein
VVRQIAGPLQIGCAPKENTTAWYQRFTEFANIFLDNWAACYQNSAKYVNIKDYIDNFGFIGSQANMKEMQSMVNMDEAQQKVEQLIASGDSAAAVKLLYEMIIQNAREKKFPDAERLRQRLMDVDPMALNEIINSAEIIEEEKTQALDSVHLETWSRLYGTLSTEEKNALYFAMKEATMESNRPVYVQGKMNSNLYFINSGELKEIYKQPEGEVLLNTLSSGDIAGQDNFFSNSVCTTSLVADSRSKLNYLERNVLDGWKKDFPNLEHQLQTFCSGFQGPTELLKQKQMDRRSLKRVKISGVGQITLLNKAGVPMAKTFKGELSDISAGGLSFEVRISKEDTARLLLGRRINVKYSFSQSTPAIIVDQDGIVVGVYPYPFEDYSIHVKFDQEMDKAAIGSIMRYSSHK